MLRYPYSCRQDFLLYRTVLVVATICLLPLSPPPATAQNAPNPTVATPNGKPVAASDTGPTLADALVKARPPHDGVVLTVNGDLVLRLPDAVLPGVQPDISEVAAEYGRITQMFGSVTAVAPPMMTVLNTDTTPINPYDGIPPNDAFKLLCGSLDDGQWGLLTGPTGLGDGDLSDAQRPLYEAMFAGTTVSYRFLASTDINAMTNTPWTPLGESDVSKLRLRLAQKLQVAVPTGKDSNAWTSTFGLDLGNKAPRGIISLNGSGKRTTLQGTTLRAVVPNAPNPSDLDFHNPVFSVPVRLDGVKTVGDLLARIGVATHLELYADRRYENRTVTTLGATTPSAGDLLGGLALCVRGAYRGVGTAYVLTNDQVGLAPRCLTADRLEAAAAAKRQEAEAAASKRLTGQRGGILGLTGMQGEEITAEELAFTPPGKPKTVFSPEYPQASVPWSMLTPAQQELAEEQFKAMNTGFQQPNRSPHWVAEGKQNGLFSLSADVTLQLLCPGVSEPTELPDNFTDGLFTPSPVLKQQLLTQNRETNAHFYGVPASVSATALAAKLALLPRRAVFARPRTATELDAVLGAMQRLGLNQLWLDVFSQGQVHTDGSQDLLTEVLAKAKGMGITVLPTVDLLDWGPDTPADARDINISGETPSLPDGSIPVSPALPSAEDSLTALIRKLAATPGVSAIAIHDTVSLEQKPEPAAFEQVYVGMRGPMFGNHDEVTGEAFWSRDLGYVTPLRLGFLRRWHLDPLDLPKSPDGALKVDVSVPEFSGRQALSGMNQAWDDWRTAAKLNTMQHLLTVAQASAGRRFPFLVRQPIDGTDLATYCLWDDPHTWLPLPRPRQITPEAIVSLYHRARWPA